MSRRNRQKPQGVKQLPFFAYGTLLPGQPNFYLWKDFISRSQNAMMTGGRLYDMGYYPMLVEEAGSVAHGMVMWVNRKWYHSVLKSLDALEGYDRRRPHAAGYRRVERKIRLATGETTMAWVYIGQLRLVAGKGKIEGNDWADHVSKSMEDMERWWLNVSSVAGLHGVEE